MTAMRAVFPAVILAVLLAAPAVAQERTQYVFAISWQPAFCETAERRPECTSQTADRPDASQFSLHGLWPQRMDYCRVSGALQLLDGERQWDELPAPKLSAGTRLALEIAMPGTQSFLDRHEFVKHGSCYGTNAEEYFRDSLAMLQAVNDSTVRTLFVQNLGRELTQEQIREAFDESFGDGAGLRVRVACERDGGRRIISELTIGLTGQIGSSQDYADLTMAARPTDGGCDVGIVDTVGIE